MKKSELKKRLKIIESLSVEAGEVLAKYERKIGKLKIQNKKTQGIATEADWASERLIQKTLKKHFPDDQFLAEESYFRQQQEGTNPKAESLMQQEALWVVDPLDGTNNFLNGFNYYSVCISLVSFGKPVLGGVYRPSSGEFFFALAGEGSFKKNLLIPNSRRKKLDPFKSKKKLKDSILVTGFATEKGQSLEQEFTRFKNVMTQVRAVRRLGSAALDLCYVAEGIFDGFWEIGLAPWDVAAAGIICQEAGVKITDINNKKFSPFNYSFLAARSDLHKKLLELFSSSSKF